MEAVAPHRRLADRYVLEEHIATGGMAAVWRARDEILARTVAVKILRDDLADDPHFLERFRREAVAAARLTHSSIVSVFDTGVEGNVCYIVMEDFGGTTLRDLMDREGPVPPERAVALTLPVLSALAFAHGNDLIHRDVKPGNILVGPDDRVKVTDFGIARAAFAGQELTTTGQVLGTVRYLSPEQVQGTDVDARSDLYSTGVVLYELLTGRVPFEAESDVATAMMRLTKHPLPPRAIRPGIPREIEGVVLKALARHPDERFSSAEAMQAALERHGSPAGILATQALPPISPDDAPPRRRSGFRSWVLVPAIVVALAALAIGGTLLAGRLGLGGPFVDDEPSPTPPTSPSPTPIEVGLAGGDDFDPQGDQEENGEEVPLAFDGDPGTVWKTERYESSPDFGGLGKEGVGLWLDLGGEFAVRRVFIDSPLPGWTFELKSGRLPDRLSEPLRSAAGRTSFTMGDDGSITVDLPNVPAQGLLIWITSLAPDDDRFAAAVGEVRVSGVPA